jgi:hypothetical protein
VESNWVHSALRPLLLPALDDYDAGEIGGMMIGRENRSNRRKPVPSPALSTTNSTCCPDENPGRRGGKPATNRLSYGTVQISYAAYDCMFFDCTYAYRSLKSNCKPLPQIKFQAEIFLCILFLPIIFQRSKWFGIMIVLRHIIHHIMDRNIFSHVRVSTDGVCIDNWFYWALEDRKYK